MKLTPTTKAHIDQLTYDMLLRQNRNAPIGDPWFQGETGEYWLKRMNEWREAGADHVGASKRIGWDK